MRSRPLCVDGRTSAWTALVLYGALACFGAPLYAQPYPSQVIKLVVPFTPGGGTDVTARAVAQQLGQKLRQTITVENRPGASAGVGAASVAREQPDGYTLLVGSATLAANAAIEGGSTNFNVINDFEFIGKMGKIDLVLVVPSQHGIDSAAQLAHLMRTQPNKVQFGSPGVGSPAHLGGELLKLVVKGGGVHVPYKGESAAVQDLIGGQLTFQLCAALACGPRIQDGSLKGLAVAAKHRSKALPNVPTTAEVGMAGVEAGTWWYLAAPKGTPAAIVARLNKALNDVYADEKFRARLVEMGVEVEPGTTPSAVKNGLRSEMKKWRQVVRAAGIKRQ